LRRTLRGRGSGGERRKGDEGRGAKKERGKGRGDEGKGEDEEGKGGNRGTSATSNF